MSNIYPLHCKKWETHGNRNHIIKDCIIVCLHAGQINVPWVILNVAFTNLLDFAIQMLVVFFFFFRERKMNLFWELPAGRAGDIQLGAVVCS